MKDTAERAFKATMSFTALEMLIRFVGGKENVHSTIVSNMLKSLPFLEKVSEEEEAVLKSPSVQYSFRKFKEACVSGIVSATGLEKWQQLRAKHHEEFPTLLAENVDSLLAGARLNPAKTDILAKFADALVKVESALNAANGIVGTVHTPPVPAPAVPAPAPAPAPSTPATRKSTRPHLKRASDTVEKPETVIDKLFTPHTVIRHSSDKGIVQPAGLKRVKAQ